MRVSFVNGTEYVSIVSLVPVNLHDWVRFFGTTNSERVCFTSRKIAE